MSSTDIDALFDDELLPLAGKPDFPLGADPSAPTYFMKREKPGMTRDDFTAPSCIGFDDFAERLAAYWTKIGRPELAAHAPRFAEVARSVFTPGAQDAEVSPFIYVMF